MVIKHKQQAIVPDQIDPTRVSAPAWNDDHEITGPWLAAMAQFVVNGGLQVGFGLGCSPVDGEPGGYIIYLVQEIGVLTAELKNYAVITNVESEGGEFRVEEWGLQGEGTNEFRLQVLKHDANGDWVGATDFSRLTVQVFMGVSAPQPF